jgi:hypothetical protein
MGGLEPRVAACPYPIREEIGVRIELLNSNRRRSASVSGQLTSAFVKSAGHGGSVIKVFSSGSASLPVVPRMI